MDSSNLLAPKPRGYNEEVSGHALAPNTWSSHPLAPTGFSYQAKYEPSEEEVEILRVGLFIDILNYEFRMHKGFASNDWVSLFKYWKKHIAQGDFWSAKNQVKKIDVKKLVKEGVLTVDTQKRLYGDEAWFPGCIEDEREKTIGWLKYLDSDDVQHTLHAYFQGGLKEIREQILQKQRKQTKVTTPRIRKTNPVIISERIYLEVTLQMFEEQKGYKTKNVTDLAREAVKYKFNPKLKLAFIKFIKLNSSKPLLAPSESVESAIVQNYVEQYSKFDEEDFEVSFAKYFQEKITNVGETALSPSATKKKPTIKYVNLSSNCSKALCTVSKYEDIPPEFENITLLIPHMKSVLEFLKRFYEEKNNVFSYSSHDFIDFCLRNNFPMIRDDWKPLKVSASSSFQRSGSLNVSGSDKQSREKAPLSESEVRMHINHFSMPKLMLIRAHLIFAEFHGYPANQGKVLYKFWEKIKPADKNIYCLWIFNSSEPIESFSLRPQDISRRKLNIEVMENFYASLSSSKIEKIKENTEKKQKVAMKLKEKYKNPKRPYNIAESKKGRWALGNKLLEIQKRFPLDPVVKHMVKVEFGENPLKKYDLEYETHNADDELKRKQGKVAFESIKSPKKIQLSQQDVIKREFNKINYIEEHAVKTKVQIKEEATKHQEVSMFKEIQKRVKQYLKFRESGIGSVSLYLSDSYVSLKAKYPLAVSKNFPYKNYGTAKKKDGQMTFSKSYPIEFKHYFFSVFKALLKTPKGVIMLKSIPALIWAPPSKNKCTIHTDTCPPDCMYTSLNKKIARQTLKSEPYYAAWHSKLRPFFRPDMNEEKKKIFMSYSDARECRFEPIVGSKIPEKHLALTFKHFSEIRNKINPEEAPNFNMWVTKLGNNLKSSDPALFKEGVFKQAKAMFIREKYKESKDVLIEHFNMPCILDYFVPGKSRPNINDKPLEDFNKPSNLELMTNVFGLYCAIKNYYQQAQKQLQNVLHLEEFDRKAHGIFDKSTSKLDKSVKKFMCPDENCTKVGCEFAHNNSELRFRQETIIRLNFKKKLQEKLKNFQPIKRTPWVPTGQLQDCVKCHSNFLYKPEEKKQEKKPQHDGRPKPKQKLRDPEIVAWSRSKCCNKCSLEQRLKDKQTRFVEKSKELNHKILERSGRNNHDVTGDQVSRQKELLVSDKIGKYRKARTLFKGRKYVESFEVMKKVIEMVRKERAVDHDNVEKKLQEIRKTIGLEHIVLEEDQHRDSLENTQVAPDKKTLLYQTQTKRLNQGSSNDFLNYQIESFYLEVEKKLIDENSYVNKLREKANNLDEIAEAPDENKGKSTSFLFKPKKVKICKYVKEGKKCPKGPTCEFAHFSTQLDLVPTTKVIQNLYHTSESLDKKLKEDILPPDWKPWRDSRALPIYPPLPLPKDLTKNKDLDKTLPFDT